MASSTKSTSLSSVAAAFNDWRTNGSNRQRVPDELRKQAAGLIGHYRKSDILREINTNHSMLNRWAKEFGPKSPVSQNQSSDNTGFVSLPLPALAEDSSAPKATEHNNTPVLTMSHHSGWTLQWHTIPQADQLQRLLNIFLLLC